MSKSGALFDILKLNDMSKDIIAAMSAGTVYDLYLAWAKEKDTAIADLLTQHEDYAKQIFNIERENENPRKDFVKWLDVKDHIEYFFDDFYKASISAGTNFPEHILSEDVKIILASYIDIYNHLMMQILGFHMLKNFLKNLDMQKTEEFIKRILICIKV